MSDSRRHIRRVLAAVLLAVSAAAGAYVATRLGPERLRDEVERQVAVATGAPCRIASLYIAPGLPIEVEARGLGLWDGALTVARARARVSIAAALLGQVRLSRLQLEDAVLSVRGRDGELEGDVGGAALLSEKSEAPRNLLTILHDGAGAALTALRLADTFVIRDGRVDFEWERSRGPIAFELEDVHARLSHHRLRGESELAAQAAIRSDGAHRGLVEWSGASRRGEPLRLSVAATELDLGWLGSLVPEGGPRPTGWISGVADLALPDREHAQVELDLVARDVGWWLVGEREPVLAVPRMSARAGIGVEPDRVSMRAARVRGGPVDASIDVTAGRPLGPDSEVDVAVRVSDLLVDDLLDLLTSMPAPWVNDAREVLEALGGGRLVSFVARSRTPSGDRPSVAPDASRGLPPGLALQAELEDLRIQLEGDDAIEDVSLRAAWERDRLALHDVVGRRRDFALPRLDLELEGVSHLLDADLRERVPPAEDALLVGLPLLLSLFEPEPGSRVVHPRIWLRLSQLEHPAVLWPVRSLALAIREQDDRLVGEIRGGTWAGVPLRGTLAWQSDPMHLEADLVAYAAGEAPEAPAAAEPFSGPAPDGLPLEGVAWAAGRVEVGVLERDVWSHRRLRGRFRAARSRVAFDAVEADTLPTGRVEGNAWLELGEADALLYRAVFTASELDADTLFTQAKLGSGLVSGRVAVSGDLRGRYQRGRHPAAALTGDVRLVAREGYVRHDLPAVLALTLAGEGIDFRSGHDRVRYTRCESRLELDDGVARTDGLEFEGPDLRMFGSGSLDLGHPPHAIDAEVVVFLFRPVDRLLGAMPIVGNLILGGADNLLAAYFELEGPWDAPTATSQPLRTLNTGPLRLVTGLPGVVRRGLESLGGAAGGGGNPPELPDAASSNGVAP